MPTAQELLQKATMSLSDFGGASEAPLTIHQVQEFLRLAITPQALLPDVRTVMNSANKWQESTIDFSSRVLKPGTEATRLVDGDRVKGTTGIIEMSTVLLRGEVPVSDEVFEDQVEGEGFSDTLMAMIAQAVGRDVEELFIAGDTGSGDPYLALLNGWLKQAQTSGHDYDAVAEGQDYQSIFNRLLVSIPDKWKRDMSDWRFYVPNRLAELYRDQLAGRGTSLGDANLEGSRPLAYQGIRIMEVPLIPITAGSPDTSSILLTNRRNLYAGWRRQIRMESFRDPREGARSFIVSARVDCKVAVADAVAIARNVNVEP